MLGLQVRLTSGPKRHALEMMRSKIEQQNERVVSARQRHAVAKQAFMLLDEELQREEEAKERTDFEEERFVRMTMSRKDKKSIKQLVLMELCYYHLHLMFNRLFNPTAIIRDLHFNTLNHVESISSPYLIHYLCIIFNMTKY